MTHDVVVIGGGISGLVSAILLAESGRRVAVLEQHSVLGGYLQQFRRKDTTFDVGFHYLGSTAPGRPMRQFLEHLRVLDRIELLPLPADRAITVRRGDREFAYPTTFSAFRTAAAAAFPREAAALDTFCADVDATCARFRWFSLKKGVDYQHPLDMKLANESFAAFAAARFTDPWLREVLGVQSFNLGLFDREIPWSKHVLAFRSNFDQTSRIRGGGGALVDALVARGRELGVAYHTRQEVAAFECRDRTVLAATTTNGARWPAALFLAACHPKPIVRCISDADVEPMFKDRVLQMRDSRGALQVWARLRAPLRSLAGGSVLVTDDAELRGEPPLHAVLVVDPTPYDGGPPRVEAMTYLDHEPFAKWAGTRLSGRGADYDAFKRQLAARVLRIAARAAPELPDLVEDVYAATPLTDAWYTKSEHGAVFGISHDLEQQGSNRPMPRLRLRNLFFSGASITMPGICGVFINAFDTCDAIRGDGVLFDAVAT